MSYTVLARKYRSRTFDEIVGQDAIATTLKNAVASGRIHHGYLFTGTRGVGKTSMARILAKSLNCLSRDAPSPHPCCECEACRMIAEGEDIDVVEIDAASNTGVDNIRDLRSNTVYRPARSRFKVYIIDEVHMLTTNAFNALLKTLEEPPDHVKFVLATTEPHKVPATIQSRCQRFDFRSIDTDTIAAQLRFILGMENIQADDTVIRRVARLAAGSMRDALSLLDQVVAYGGSTLTAELLEHVLPPAHDELVHDLVEHLVRQDAAGALRSVERCLSTGYTADRLCDTLVDQLRTLMLLCVCGAATDLVDLSGPLKARLALLAESLDAPTYVYMISLCEEVRRSIKGSRAARPLVDAATVRLACADRFSSVETILARLERDEGAPAGTAAQAKKKGIADAPAPSDPDPQASRPRRPAAPAPSTTPRPGRVAVEATPVSSADKRRVLAAPLVRRVLELTDGVLTNVRTAGPSESEPAGDGNHPTGPVPAGE